MFTTKLFQTPTAIHSSRLVFEQLLAFSVAETSEGKWNTRYSGLSEVRKLRKRLFGQTALLEQKGILSLFISAFVKCIESPEGFSWSPDLRESRKDDSSSSRCW